MACAKDLFTLLGGSPTGGGTWSLTSITGTGAPSSGSLQIAEGDPPGAYHAESFTITPTSPHPFTTGEEHIWWDPQDDDAPSTCYTSWVYTFTYTPPEEGCANPPLSTITWTLTNAPASDSAGPVYYCDGMGSYDMKADLSPCGKNAPAGGTWTKTDGPIGIDPVSGGMFNTSDAGVMPGQDYTYTYTVDLDGAGTCTECVVVHTLLIHINGGGSAGTSGVITTCV